MSRSHKRWQRGQGKVCFGEEKTCGPSVTGEIAVHNNTSYCTVP